jgi:MFS transporter, PAT family, beta-lactamase induction signal transducer AmpG
VSRRLKIFWVVVLYLSQGFPFGVITFQLPVYFRQNGVSLADIGFLSLLTLPWSLKIGWAPIVDRYGQRKHWIAAMQIVMAILLFQIPFFDVARASTSLFVLILAICFASATADIAIDAYAIEILEKEDLASWGNAARINSWKAAYMLATGAVGVVASKFNWTVAFYCAGIFLLILLPVTLFAPSSTQKRPVDSAAEPKPEFFSKKFWLEGYVSLLKRPGILAVLLFILLYKLGSSTIAPMIRPFWVDRGYDTSEIGLVSGTLGTAESFVAPLVAAWLITRVRLFNAIWIFGILQVAPALLYAAVAHWDLGRPFMYAASLSESFDLSLAQVAFTGFLAIVCEKKYAATQYAFLSCVFAFTRSVAGWVGSFGAKSWGYEYFFTFTFFLGFVAFLFLPAVKRWIAEQMPNQIASKT